MTKHTLGPWRVNDKTIFQDNPLDSVVMIASCSSAALEHKEQQANARLIAAAPDLLAALNKIMRIMGSREPGAALMYAEVTEVFDAIRKAGGEPNE